MSHQAALANVIIILDMCLCLMRLESWWWRYHQRFTIAKSTKYNQSKKSNKYNYCLQNKGPSKLFRRKGKNILGLVANNKCYPLLPNLVAGSSKIHRRPVRCLTQPQPPVRGGGRGIPAAESHYILSL